MSRAQSAQTRPVASRERVLGIFTPAGLWMSGAIALAMGLLFHRWLYQQNQFSSKHLEDWGHAYVIPLISGYMVWLQRDAIQRLTPRAYWPGLLVLLLGLVCYAFFTLLLPNHMLSGGAIVLTILGTVLTLLGPAYQRYLFLPIAYLVFAITISEQIMIEVTFRLQQIASQGAYVVLSLAGPLMGFGVDIEGNTLEMIVGGESRMMNVAEACSGMRMVVAFVALAGAVALLGTREWWKRFALLLLAVPVAVFMNVVRVAVLGFVTLWDPNLAAGDAHTFIGTMLLFPALGLYMLVVWALNRIVQTSPAQEGVA